MKLNSVSGIVYDVKNIEATAKFYETLGFRVGKRTDTTLTMYLNWFWIEFNLTNASPVNELSGITLYIKVDSVADFYQLALANSLQTDGPPLKQVSGRAEFILHDPDGRRLAFFEKS